ncbi:MAG TPA: TonB-dependent receptor [Thermoanaerobaculia bacterium]
MGSSTRFSICVSFLVCVPLAFAAAADTPEAAAKVPKVKGEIVVTAAREEQPRDQAAAAVTVLARKTIERLPASSLAELLAFVPGVTMMFDSGASGIPMITSRGFFGGGEVEYVKLMIDGVPVGDAESGNVDWQRFRAADIDRIEMLHGPGSALYGDTALGGVIEVFTRAGTATDETNADVHAGGGSFAGRDLSAHYATGLSQALRLGAAAGAWSTGGFRDHANTDDRLLQLSLERLGDTSRAKIDAFADSEVRHQPGPLTASEIATDRTQSEVFFRFDRESTTRRRLDAAFDSYGAIPWRATLYGVTRDDDNLRTLLLAPGFGTSAFRSLATKAGGGTLETSREWSRFTLRAGSDFERALVSGRYNQVTPTGAIGASTGDENGSRTRAALFVTGGWAATDRVRFSAGIRRDEIRDDMTASTTQNLPRASTASAWSPRAGVNVHFGPEPSPLSLFAQFSHAFKAPTLDQLFDPRTYPDGRGGTFTISNADLRPQRAHNLEAGLSRATPWSDWSLVAYRLGVRDEIDFDPQTFTYRNIGSSLHRGVEASAAFAKTAWLSPQVTYSWTRVADNASPSKQLKNIPEHVAQLLLHARISASTSADAIYRWRGTLALDDDDVFREPAVSRVDFRFAHEVGSVRWQADLLNAFSAHYNELGYVLADFKGRPNAFEFPAPGRALRIGMTWSLSRRRNG